MNLDTLICEVNAKVKSFVDSMEAIQATDIYLDNRSANRLWIDSECIAVELRYDRSLQYYGGFEYIDAEYRTQVGDYVFYSSEASRVADLIETWESTKEEE